MLLAEFTGVRGGQTETEDRRRRTDMDKRALEEEWSTSY